LCAKKFLTLYCFDSDFEKNGGDVFGGVVGWHGFIGWVYGTCVVLGIKVVQI